MTKARSSRTVAQPYPRILDDTDKSYGLLDTSQLAPHTIKISFEQLKQIIEAAIANANQKSSREILSIPSDATEQQIKKIYEKEGRELFKYFKKYCSDPASTAYEIRGKHYEAVAKEQFRNRTLQKQRMNSGWRYQYLAKDCAQASRRFRSISDIGAVEADFNAVVDFQDSERGSLNLYVSIKNRSNTMGGQDWPKAIAALEEIAKSDKNKIGTYCCVFGIVMDRGQRYMKIEKRSKQPYSVNTEVWLSDFFWPFFANYSYEEMMMAVLDVLVASNSEDDVSSLEEIEAASPEQIEIPALLIETFGKFCQESGLINEDGRFNDPRKLVQFFCNK